VSWASLFHRTLEYQGVDIDIYEVRGKYEHPTDGTRIMDAIAIRGWTFNGPGTSPNEESTYYSLDVSNAMIVTTNSSAEAYVLSPTDILPGQSNGENSPAFFERHMICEYGGNIYDPSYGLDITDQGSWDGTLAAYASTAIDGVIRVYGDPQTGLLSEADLYTVLPGIGLSDTLAGEADEVMDEV
jgi:hypothetical protein